MFLSFAGSIPYNAYRAPEDTTLATLFELHLAGTLDDTRLFIYLPLLNEKWFSLCLGDGCLGKG